MTSIVYDAQMTSAGRTLRLDLPDRSFRGVLSDARGTPLAGVAFSGHLAPDGGGVEELPASAVTQFKGVTAADGVFEVIGVANGRWSLSFNGSLGERHFAHSADVTVRPSDQSEKTMRIVIDVKP